MNIFLAHFLETPVIQSNKTIYYNYTRFEVKNSFPKSDFKHLNIGY